MGKALFRLLQLTVCLDIMLCTSGCVIGDVPDVLRLNMTHSEEFSGFYLNLNKSAQCYGQIVSWMGCYYLEESNVDTHIELDVGIWRPTMDGYKLIGNLSKLTTPPVNPSYTFICQTWDLSCEDRLSVERGDVIGVYLSSTEMRFNVLGSAEEGSVYRKESQRNEANILNELSPVLGYGLYIEATIEQGLGSGMERLCPSVYSTVMTPIPTSTLGTTGSTPSADLPLPLWAVYVIAIMGAIILILVVMFVLVLCTKSRMCVTAKRRKEWTDLPGERSSEDNVVPVFRLMEPDTGTHTAKATPPVQANATVLSNLNAELHIVVTDTQELSGSNYKVGNDFQHNGAITSFSELSSAQHATPPTAKPRKESLFPAASCSGKEGTVQCATPPMAKPRKESLIPSASGFGRGGAVQHTPPPIAKPRRGILNSTVSESSEVGSVQPATPPTVKPRKDIPIPKPRVNLNKKAATGDFGIPLVVDHKNLRKSKSECDLLRQHPPAAILSLPVDTEAQRYSDLTGSTESYPYVIRSWEQSYSISLPDLRKVPLLPPRGASVSSVHGSYESLYAIPHQVNEPQQVGEPQPYLEFQPIYSYAYAKLPLKYRTIAASNWSSWNKELSSPHRNPGVPLSVVPQMRNKLTDGREVGKGLVTSHVQGQGSKSEVFKVDSDQLNPLPLNIRDRSKIVHPQASGMGNQLNSPEYAEIDEGEVKLGFNHFSTSPPVGGTTNISPSAKKQEVSNPQLNSPSYNPRLSSREWSPKPGKVVKHTGHHNGVHSSKSEHLSAGYQVAEDPRKLLGSSIQSTNIDYENDDEFLASRGSSQHYMNLKESTMNRSSTPYTHAQKVSGSISDFPNQSFVSDLSNKSLCGTSPQESRKNSSEQHYVHASNRTSAPCDDYDHLSKPTS